MATSNATQPYSRRPVASSTLEKLAAWLATELSNVQRAIPNYGNVVIFSDAAPTTGTWAQGDLVFNNLPVAGGYIGWTCVVAGSPGTWKQFGAIHA